LVRYLQAKGLSAEKVSRTGYTGSDISMVLLAPPLPSSGR
jgi:hypothetical protein